MKRPSVKSNVTLDCSERTRGEWRRPESTVSLSVTRANNGAPATALRVMCTDVIRLAAACGSVRGLPPDSLSLLEPPLMHGCGGGSCHCDVTQENEVIV